MEKYKIAATNLICAPFYALGYAAGWMIKLLSLMRAAVILGYNQGREL